MKKYLKIALIYTSLALIGGVFFREFTKFNNFTGVTALGKVHVHFFTLGMFVFMLIALFSKHLNFENKKTFKIFFIFYNIGLIISGAMLLTRGIMQVMEISLSKGINSMISGIAGIGHVLLGIGIILLLVSLIQSSKDSNA